MQTTLPLSITPKQNFIARHAARVVLQNNVSKTKCLTINKNDTNLQITGYDNQITQVSEFVYLSHIPLSTNNSTINVKYRIGLGWATLNKKQKNPYIKKSTK